MADRIQRNEDGSLDEIVVENCTFHLEQMRHDSWWIGVSRGDGDIALSLWCARGRLTVRVIENTLVDPCSACGGTSYTETREPGSRVTSYKPCPACQKER